MKKMLSSPSFEPEPVRADDTQIKPANPTFHGRCSPGLDLKDRSWVSCIGFQKPVEEPRSRMKTPKPGWTGHICSANDLHRDHWSD